MLQANQSNRSRKSTNLNTSKERKTTETKNHTIKEKETTTTDLEEKREDIKNESKIKLENNRMKGS